MAKRKRTKWQTTIYKTYTKTKDRVKVYLHDLFFHGWFTRSVFPWLIYTICFSMADLHDLFFHGWFTRSVFPWLIYQVFFYEIYTAPSSYIKNKYHHLLSSVWLNKFVIPINLLEYIYQVWLYWNLILMKRCPPKTSS
jgi:hypothetical protein